MPKVAVNRGDEGRHQRCAVGFRTFGTSVGAVCSNYRRFVATRTDHWRDTPKSAVRQSLSRHMM
jgi:hypothetical protein